MSVRILVGDARAVLATLPAESVHCVVTSPPYWGLRDYGLPPTVWGGEEGCGHTWGDELPARGRSNWDSFDQYRDETDRGHGGYHADKPSGSKTGVIDPLTKATGHGTVCTRCNAWRGALGLEPTPEAYVAHLVEVFRAVRRVLRSDGVCFVNLGDAYQDKQLLGLPWRVAQALQEPGRSGARRAHRVASR